MNKIVFTGRLAADSEIRHSPNGDAALGFRVASDVGFGDNKTTNWFSCTIWGRRAESLKRHLVKGKPVTIAGSLTLREWTDRDGAKRLSPDVRVDELDMHGGRDDAQGSSQPRQQPAQNQYAQQSGGAVGGIDDFDVPF